jgi:outer membrane immunogenic protein
MKILLGSVALVALAAGPAMAADMKAAPVYTKAPMMAPPYNWNGFYLGANGGYGWGTTDTDAFNAVTGVLVDHTSYGRSGGFVGGQIGANWQFAPNFLLGVEGDIQGSSLKGSIDSCLATGCAHADSNDNWFATLRGRLGVVSNNWLFYVTGGGAWVNGSVTRTITAAPAFPVLVGQASTATFTDTGWTVGGGIEYGFAPSWTVKAEYLYLDVKGSRDFSYSLAAAGRHDNTEQRINVARVGINYLLNWTH